MRVGFLPRRDKIKRQNFVGFFLQKSRIADKGFLAKLDAGKIENRSD